MKSLQIATYELIGKLLLDVQTTPQYRCDKFYQVSECIVLGYLINPLVINTEIVEYFKEKAFNANATLRQSWDSVASKSNRQLAFDQCMSYYTQYSMIDHNIPFLPDTTNVPLQVDSIQIIEYISKQDLILEVLKLIKSGIALKQEVIDNVLSILINLDVTVDINDIANREFKLLYMHQLSIVPKDPVEALRLMIYESTKETLLIKNKDLIAKIKSLPVPIKRYVDVVGYEQMSSIFLRYKPLFLAFKVIKDNAPIINKLRKMAIKFHKPVGQPVYETLLSDTNLTLLDVVSIAKKLTNFKIITILRSIKVRLLDQSTRVFHIRNQKLYIKMDDKLNIDSTKLLKIYGILMNQLFDNMIKKSCKVKLPEGIELVLPTSNKSFIGNYPNGSYIPLGGEDVIVGINWKETNGINDLDLSYNDLRNNKYGWNSYHRSDDACVLFSGDVVTGDPEGTELFYFKQIKDHVGLLKVNLFNGDMNSKFNVFVAKEHITNLTRNYMVDPNNIVCKYEEVTDSKEKTLGFIASQKYMLTSTRLGNGRVSYSSSRSKCYIDYLVATHDTYINLVKFLEHCNFKFVTSSEEADIDLSTGQTSIINLFSK